MIMFLIFRKVYIILIVLGKILRLKGYFKEASNFFDLYIIRSNNSNIYEAILNKGMILSH